MFDMSLVPEDASIIKRIVNVGIDSRLEGFTQSIFNMVADKFVGSRLQCKIHSSEMQVLIRRLLEDDTEEAEMLADDIVYVEYDCEPLP